MKLLLLSLFISLWTPISFSPADFPHQLSEAIAAAQSDFSGLKGQKSVLATGETVYKSKMEIQGTINNRIGSVDGKPYFTATILEKGGELQAQNTVKLWKTKVGNALGRMYTPTPFSSYDKKALRDGVIFSYQRNMIALFWISPDNSEDYEVSLVITANK